MSSRGQVQDDHDFASGKISELSRTISLSVLALVWLFIAGGSDAPSLPAPPNRALLLTAGAMVFLSLLSDYFQYVAGYVTSNRLLVAADKTGKKDLEYDDKAFLYRSRKVLFWLKQICALAAVAVLVVAVILPLLSAQQ